MPIWRGWKAVGEMVSHVLSAVPRTQALTELASFPSHLHFTNKEVEAQEALPGPKGFMEDRVDSNIDCLLTNVPVGFSSESPFPGLMHRVRLNLIPVSPSRCAPRPSHLLSSSQKVSHLGAVHTCAIYDSCPPTQKILLSLTQGGHRFLIWGQRFSHIHLR